MAFRRSKKEEVTARPVPTHAWPRRANEPEEPPDTVRQSASDDAFAHTVADQAVADWLKRFPDIANWASKSDVDTTDTTALEIEAFSTAAALQRAIDAGEATPNAIFNEQIGIAQHQARMGMTTEWVVVSMQIRCIAVANMWGALGDGDASEQFAALFSEFLHDAGFDV